MSARAHVVGAFAALYLIWGSTYLGILYAIETIPPFIMAGSRFLAAGLALYAVVIARDSERPGRAHWRAAAIVGCLLMAGNACVALAEQRIPSGIASLLVALTPLWFVLIEWWRPRGKRPTIGVTVGLLVGLAGVAVLIGPGQLAGDHQLDLVGAGIVIFGSVVWALGSMYSRYAPRTDSAFLMTAMQMICGGAFLTAISIGTGELARFDVAAVSSRSAWAWVYLTAIGSLVGFTSYVYLLRVSTPARVATYAYVNPAVAVFLGWAFAGEPISMRVLLASAVIVAGVALITTFGGTGSPPAKPEGETRLRRVTDEYPVPDSA